MSAAEFLRTTHVSYSKLQAYARCPHRFKLEYLDGCPSKPSKAMELGSVVHEVIARYLLGVQGLPRVCSPTVEELVALIRPTCAGLRERGDLQGWVDEEDVVGLLSGLPRLLPRVDGRAVTAVEATKHTKLGPWTLKAVLDLVLTNAHGQNHIIDFKTGKPKYVGDGQLRSYALPVLGSSDSQCDSVRLTYAFLRDVSLRSSQVSRRDCPEIVDDIVRQVRTIEADTKFQAQPGPLCRWCGVCRFCSSYA